MIIAIMNNFIETQRSNIEELDIIEDSVSKKLLKNPFILPSHLQPKQNFLISKINKPKSTKRLTLQQQYELKYFNDRHNQIIKDLNHCLNSEKELFDKALPEPSFEKFDELINNIPENEEMVTDPRVLYSSYSSLDKEKFPNDVTLKIKNGKELEFVKRKHILSYVASHLKNLEIDETLDMHKFHDIYVNNFGKVSYIEYLYKFMSFPYNTTNGSYTTYLTELSEFLTKRLIELYPLTDYQELLKSWKSNFKVEEGKPNEKGEIFCEPCNKIFAKQTVYDAHLSGKKHKKNAQNISQKDSLIPWMEYLIQKLCDELKLDLEYTRSEVEKLANASEREIQLDKHLQREIENEFVNINEDDNDSEVQVSDDEGDDSFKNLPLGPDGTPIPFWLYKLQGLHKQYKCEICGNITYKGKKVFVKHFNEPKHQYGLKCLGIDEDKMVLFKNIVKIDEVVQLWRSLKKEIKTQSNEIEIEDKHGNVMSEKDYLDLKKQGLL
ncbi:Pre-mRNA-splicing factor PRP9 [Candida tropicalis]